MKESKKIMKQEISNTDVSIDEMPVKKVPLETKSAAQKEFREPNEAFFGTLLLFSFALTLLATVVYFGYAGYQMYKGVQSEKAIPSIEGLPRMAENPKTTAVPVAPVEAKNPISPTVTIDKKTLAVKVLNGGAPKGSASTYTEVLKKAGYTLTTFGNPFGSYTGVTLYHAVGKEKEAEALKRDIATTYPKVVVKVAPAGDKDANAAPFVVILGQ